MMMISSRRFLAIFLGSFFVAACDSQPIAPEIGSPLEDRYTVVLKDSVPDPQSAVDELVASSGAQLRFRYSDGVIQGFAGTIPEEGVDVLRADSRVDYVTPVRHVEVRPVSQSLYSASVGSQLLPWGIDTVNAEASSTRSGDGSGAVGGVHVYVLDTGIAAHPDLNVVGRVNFAGGETGDCNGHGTHVAGTIAARDNSSGVVGVAPGARLYGIKVLDCNGAGTTSAVIKGVNWVVKNARRPAVVNMSLGTGSHAPALHDAIVGAIRRGITFVVAAGNANVDAANTEPAHIPEAITVGAAGQGRCKAAFSNWGGRLDLFAPGEGILSTWLDGGLAISSGTSMAAPHVAGGAALYLRANPSSTPSQVRTALVRRGRSVVRCGFATSAQNTATTDVLQNIATF